MTAFLGSRSGGTLTPGISGEQRLFRAQPILDFRHRWPMVRSQVDAVKGLSGKNNRSQIITQPDPVLVAILVNREHSRLSSHINTLEKLLHSPYSDKEHLRLVKLAASWRELLADDDGAPKIAAALEAFIAAYRRCPAPGCSCQSLH